MTTTSYDCQSCGKHIDCTCNVSTAVPCVACSSHVCVSTILKDDSDLTSREYLRRRIWSDAWVAAVQTDCRKEAERWADIALAAYDKKFVDSKDKP